jgi:hydrogenase maturation factor
VRGANSRTLIAKTLARFCFCITFNQVRLYGKLPKHRKQIAIIAALAEGSSIRAIERMTGVHRDSGGC